MKNKQKITDTSCPSCWEKWNEQNKNNIDEVEIEIQQKILFRYEKYE